MTLDEMLAQGLPADAKSPEARDLLANLLKGQQAAVNQQNEAANLIEAQPNELDLTPLAALADAWGNGRSNLAARYNRPKTPEERQLMVSQLRKIAGDDQQDITKNVLAYLSAGGKAAAAAAKADTTAADRATRMVKDIPDKIKNDASIMKIGTQNQGSIQNGLALISDPTQPVTPQRMFSFFNDQANALTFRGGNAATDTKVLKEEINTFKSDWAKIKQKFKPDVDLRKEDPKLVETALRQAQTINEHYNVLLGKQMKSLLRQNRSAFPKNDPRYQIPFDQMEAEFIAQHPEWVAAAEKDEAEQKAKKEKSLAPAGAAPSNPDQEAIEWAQANQNDVKWGPKAKQILKLHGL